jgi:hypothetical protein
MGTVFAQLAGASGHASCGAGRPGTSAPPITPTVTLVATSNSIAYHHTQLRSTPIRVKNPHTPTEIYALTANCFVEPSVAAMSGGGDGSGCPA